MSSVKRRLACSWASWTSAPLGSQRSLQCLHLASLCPSSLIQLTDPGSAGKFFDNAHRLLVSTREGTQVCLHCCRALIEVPFWINKETRPWLAALDPTLAPVWLRAGRLCVGWADGEILSDRLLFEIRLEMGPRHSGYAGLHQGTQQQRWECLFAVEWFLWGLSRVHSSWPNSLQISPILWPFCACPPLSRLYFLRFSRTTRPSSQSHVEVSRCRHAPFVPVLPILVACQINTSILSLTLAVLLWTILKKAVRTMTSIFQLSGPNQRCLRLLLHSVCLS